MGGFYGGADSGRALPPIGTCRLWTVDQELELHCLLGDGAPKLSGYGGHVYRERPRRPPLTLWEGPSGVRLTLQLVLEHREVPGSGGVRRKIRTLERMAGMLSGSPAPALNVAANLPHHDEARAPDDEWLVERDGLERGEPLYVDGELVAQPATVTLLRQTTTEVETLPRSAPFARKTLRKGETLRHFAQRVLGDGRRWRDVASLNRDDSRCPQVPDRKAARAHDLKVPPREPVRRKPAKPKSRS